ncbi:MAG: hypothetical protein LBG15_03400, partial [Dysgonamonadaceae bacterium]|nr:hypothetical protein [Dysgonamonadaceae bacterium]
MKKYCRILSCFCLFILPKTLCFPLGNSEGGTFFRQAIDEGYYSSGEVVDTQVSAGAQLNPLGPDITVQRGPSTAERVMKALSRAQPKRLSEAVFKDDDWAVELNGKWYY